VAPTAGGRGAARGRLLRSLWQRNWLPPPREGEESRAAGAVGCGVGTLVRTRGLLAPGDSIDRAGDSGASSPSRPARSTDAQAGYPQAGWLSRGLCRPKWGLYGPVRIAPPRQIKELRSYPGDSIDPITRVITNTFPSSSVDRVPRDGPPLELLGFMRWGLAMGDLHDLIATHGKKAALEGGLARRDVIEAAAAYLADESDALACAYSGWAQCALPHRRLPPDQPWEVASGPMALVVEPGRRRKADGTLEWCGIPFGSHARLILLYLQTQALRRDSREVPLGDSWRDWLHRMGLSWGGNTGRSVREQAELLSRCKLTFHLGQPGRHGMINQGIGA
jgi:hypothetical protein